MSVLEKILNLFKEAGVPFEKYEHEPVFTSEEAAKIRNTDISMGAKALVFYADSKPVLLVVPGDKKADSKKFKKAFGIKDLRMAAPEEVLSLTGLKVGSIPPVGKAMNLPSYFDESFKLKDKVAFNAGMHTVSIVMTAKDLIRAENPKILDLVQS